MPRVATVDTAASRPLGSGAVAHDLVPPADGSPLSLAVVRLGGGSCTLGDPRRDTLLFVAGGSGTLGAHDLDAGSGALLAAGEEAELAGELEAVVALVGAGSDVHAPMGGREPVVRIDDLPEAGATGSRSFQVLFGPHNGSLRATFFLGSIPPGAAKRHYHLYDEIVWVVDGPGRLHLEGEPEELPAGSAFRLAPRERHVVENLGAEEMAVLGVFAPAGSPSAAYLD